MEMVVFNHSLDKIFRFLILKTGNERNKKIILKTKNILFEGFDLKWLFKNQKFDFSLSFAESPKNYFRFSYNDFGEKHLFHEKIFKIFKIFKQGSYSILTLKKILKIMNVPNYPHQTTLGFEWQNTTKFPRIKLYFEELFHFYSRLEIEKKLKKVSQILKLSFKNVFPKNEQIGAFCIDFFPKKKENAKVYFLFQEKKILEKEIEKVGLKIKKEQIRNFLNCLEEKKKFFYLTYRISSNNTLVSAKIYQIFEVQQILDFSELIFRIFSFLKETNIPKATSFLSQLINLSKKNHTVFYPVIFASDFPLVGCSQENFPKYDLYFSVKPIQQ